MTVVEVGPRDGLQNERAVVSTADKIAFVNRLSAARPAGHRGLGVRQPEVGAADGRRRRGVRRHHAAAGHALHRARPEPRRPRSRAGAPASPRSPIFAASTETFSRKNINQSIDESLATYTEVCDRALAAGLRVRGYLSTAFGCPYEGEVPPATRRGLSRASLIDLGVFEVAVSDTIGIAHPGQVPRVLDAVLARVPVDQVALHFHDTRGTALANVLAALPFGIATFDASAGGLGGCPYAPGAAGNLATDDLIYMLNGLGIETGVSLPALSEASAFIADRLDHRAAVALRAGGRHATSESS